VLRHRPATQKMFANVSLFSVTADTELDLYVDPA